MATLFCSGLEFKLSIKDAQQLAAAENLDGGTYGSDPKLRAPEEGDLTPRDGSPASKVGAHALPKG